MSRTTDFDFGANIGWEDADNLAPWGSGTEAGGETEPAPSEKETGRTADLASVSGFNEQVGYSGFVALIIDDFQVDAFIKCVSMQLNIFREEIRKMAQAPSPSQPTSQKQGYNKQQTATNSNRSGFPFLKVEMMTRDPKPAKIMDFQISPEPANGQRKFNDVILKLFYNGGLYLWGLKTSNPHYISLYEWFGGEMEDWKEKSFLLGTEVNEFNGRVFAHVEPMPSGENKKKK